MERLNLNQITKWLIGKIYKDFENIFIENISIDSRIKQYNSLFIALKGEHFNAHDFINEAIKNGAIAAIVSESVNLPLPIIKVNNTHKALRDIAREYIKQFSIKKIAITGSTGKTTFKELLSYAIEENYIKTQANMNNLIGVPLTVFNITHKTEYAIIEAGMNQTGELEQISYIVKPDIVIITCINKTHIGNFNSFEDLINAKMEILKYANRDNTLIINGDNKYILNFIPKNQKYITFGINANNKYYPDSYELKEHSVIVKIKNNIYKVNVPGIGMVYSIICLYALKNEFNNIKINIENALNKFRAPQGRMSIFNIDNITIIDDSYNASPVSIENAINVLDKFSSRKIAILGDMYELGEQTKIMHENLAKIINESTVDTVLLYGEYMKYTFEKLNIDAKHFDTKEQLFSYLINIIKPQDTLLFKASRSIKMEEIVQKIKEYYAV